MHADVAIHCGDLTEESKLDEFRSSLRLLKEISAPLKLVIAGNHDFTMDISIFKKKVADAKPSLDPDLVKKIYGDYGEAKRLFDEAKDAGIQFLDEGNHQFLLNNGALLNVFASPWTPSLGDWGFQYRHDHDFTIPHGVDLVLTHGPPKGVLDYSDSRQRAGCSKLFAAVAKARPRLHCFGHIHEGWGAKLVTWHDHLTENPSHFTDIDNDRSILVEKLSNFRPSRFDTPEEKEAKKVQEESHQRTRCRATSHCLGDEHPLAYGRQTLFVNAATKERRSTPCRCPGLWNLIFHNLDGHPSIFQVSACASA